MWVAVTGSSILAQDLTKSRSGIGKYCFLSVVKFLVVSTTLPFLILFDKEGKPSKYITFGRKFLKTFFDFTYSYVVKEKVERFQLLRKEGKGTLSITSVYYSQDSGAVFPHY